MVATIHLLDVLVKGHGCDMDRTKTRIIILLIEQYVVCWDSQPRVLAHSSRGSELKEWQRWFS